MKLAVLLVSFLALATRAFAAPYAFTPLVDPRGSFVAGGLNNAGQVVGRFYQTIPTLNGPRAVESNAVYDNGVFRIEVPSDTTGSDRPTGINDAGVYVGYINYKYTRAFTSSFGQPSSYFDLGNGLGTQASGINDAGQIVGSYRSGYPFASTGHGFVGHPDSITTIDVPGAEDTSADGINDAGQVVGSYRFLTPSGNSAFGGYVFSGGSLTLFDVPGAAWTEPGAINDAGEIAGTYLLANGGRRGFLYADGAFTDITGPDGRAFFPVGLNDSGRLVGRFSGDDVSYLATLQAAPQPVPEPASVALFSSLVLIGGLLRRKRFCQRSRQ